MIHHCQQDRFQWNKPLGLRPFSALEVIFLAYFKVFSLEHDFSYAGFVGNTFFGYFANKFGRKKPLLAIVILVIVSFL